MKLETRLSAACYPALCGTTGAGVQCTLYNGLNDAAAPLPQAFQRGFPMAALIALGLCFGLFALFNLIEFKRLD